jgi:hypothetical protein
MALDQLPFVRRELARLVQDVRRDDQLADVVNGRAHAEPEQVARLASIAHCQRAREIGDPLTVPLRVSVLRFDRPGPMPRDLEELSLQSCRAAIQIHHLSRGGELREDAMAAVEMDERVAQTALAATGFAMLARYLRRKQ